MGARKYMTGYLAGLLLISVGLTSWSQVEVERSKDKVIISGTPYYVHIVKKGETAYSIARAYAVTVEEINRENPPAVYGINEGQALRIPVRAASDTRPPEERPPVLKRDEAKFIYHKLQPGQTIYYLSRLYGVSESEIVESNPGVEISRLAVNAEIAVPRRDFRSERQEFAVPESNYIFHRVVRGESLASIADKYGLSVRDLRRENRNIRFPQVGDFIRIPVTAGPDPAAGEPAHADSIQFVAEQPPPMPERPTSYTPVRNLKGSINVALLLPFYLRENSARIDIDSSQIVKGRRIYKTIKRSDDWIYPASTGFIEMYEGVLLALDTLRSLGLDINLNVYDIRSDTIELTRLIRSGTLDRADLIIGPVYSRNLLKITDYARSRGIPVVSPVPLYNNTALRNNPNLFIANASLEVAQSFVARKTGEYSGNNIVFIHTDTAGIDPDITSFKGKIFGELINRIPYEEIRFKEFIFYSRSAFNSDSINRLGHALSKDVENTIIIASEEAPVISETLMEIHTLSRKFPVRVLGYPAMRTMDNLEPKYFFELDITMYSPFWIDYSRKDVKKFAAGFREKFLTEPHEMSYAWFGYDIAYYFISGLVIHGDRFVRHPEIHNPDLLHTQFDFRRKSNSDGFENYKLYPVNYTPRYEIILLPDEIL